MQKLLPDMHTHSSYSHDGRNTLQEMLERARELGVCFYGVSDHFDYDYDRSLMSEEEKATTVNTDAEEYFHGARHLQEDYEGVMNVLVGAEFGFSDSKEVQEKYREVTQKYKPDFVINSVHGVGGRDFIRFDEFRDKTSDYKLYLGLIRRSLDVEYPYDIVAHIGYIARYVPYEDRSFDFAQVGEEIDDILKTIIAKDKILEINSSTKNLPWLGLPDIPILERYYELGGRKISYGSDSHFTSRILDGWDKIVAALKKIGFTYLTVPCKGEHIKVEI